MLARSRTVDDQHLADDNLAVSEQLATGPSVALSLIKQEIAPADTASLYEALRFEAQSQGRAFASDDFEEGIRAFQEKRKAVFKGR